MGKIDFLLSYYKSSKKSTFDIFVILYKIQSNWFVKDCLLHIRVNLPIQITSPSSDSFFSNYYSMTISAMYLFYSILNFNFTEFVLFRVSYSQFSIFFISKSVYLAIFSQNSKKLISNIKINNNFFWRNDRKFLIHLFSQSSGN